MGNVHEVTQSEPFHSGHGAALPLRAGAALVDDKFPSYTSLGRAMRRIGRTGHSAQREYLQIATGGKWGYDYDLEKFLAKNAPSLEDSVFYVSDEYAMYVREFRIANGELTVEFVAPDNSHVGLVLVERPKHRDFGLELLVDMLDGMWWSNGTADEPTSVRFRAVMALVQYRPDRWQTWYQLGLLKGDYAHAAAVEAFERALAIAPADARTLVEVGLLSALANDPLRALAHGRTCAARWAEHALRDRGTYGSPFAAGLYKLADLEREHGAPDLAAGHYAAWLRATDQDGLGHRLYNLACLHAATRPETARSYLRVALTIEPSLAGSAATDPDLAAIR